MGGKISCVIPARHGSLRVPNKNIRILNGHPVIAYSIQTALEAIKIAYQEIQDMIELNFETAGELGGGTTEAQSIINRIEEFKKKVKVNF